MDFIELASSLIVDDGKVLLVYDKGKKHWRLPGGKVEDDETATGSALRHSKQEIGVDMELRKPFYSGEFEDSGQLYLWHCYMAETTEELVIEGLSENIKWFEAEELDSIELAPNLNMILPALRKI